MVLFDYTVPMLGNPSLEISNISVDYNSGQSGGGIFIQGAKDCIDCSLYDISYTNAHSST